MGVDPHDRIAGLNAALARRRAGDDLNHAHGAAIVEHIRLLPDVDADPAIAGAAILVKFGHDLRHGFDRKRIDGFAVIGTRRHQADDFALRVEERAADFAGADRDVGVDVGGGEAFDLGKVGVDLGEIARIKAADRPLGRRDRQAERVADGHDAVAGLEAA